MSDREPDTEAAEANAEAGAPDGDRRDPIFSSYGLGSAALGLLAVAAVLLGTLIWSGHHRDLDERTYQTKALHAAAAWTTLLANIDTDNVEHTMMQLRDGTVGPLNAEFDSAVQPYRDVVRRLKSHSTGQIDAVAIESVHRDERGGPARPPGQPLPPELASRTDTVLVVATSVAENAGAGEPKTVHWLLRLDVSDVSGKLMISGLEFLR